MHLLKYRKLTGLLLYMRKRLRSASRKVSSMDIEITTCACEAIDSVDLPSYYWDVDRLESYRLLEDKEDGAFLIRNSSHPSHKFAISYKRNGTVASMLVEYKQGLYSIGFTNPGLPARTSLDGLIQALMAHSKDHSLVMKTGDCRDDIPRLKLAFPLYRVKTLKEHCKRVLMESLPNCTELSEFQLPCNLIDFIKE